MSKQNHFISMIKINYASLLFTTSTVKSSSSLDDSDPDEDSDAVSLKISFFLSLHFLLASDGVRFFREISGFAIKSIISSPISGFTISSNWRREIEILH